MQIYNATDKELSLYHDTLGLLGISESDTTTFPVDGTFTRYANAKYRDLLYLAWKNSTDWVFDDSNHTDFPEATTTLVVGQKDYTMPSTLVDLQAVSVLDPNGNFQELRHIKEADIPGDPDEWFASNARPEFYELKGNSIRIYPSPSSTETTLAAGLKLTFVRNIDEFTPADTTQEPGVPAMLHRYISIGSALDFATSMEMVNKINILTPMFNSEKAKAEDYFANRGNIKPRIFPKYRQPI